MSVKDPLLKELKGYATKLITDCSKPITDVEPKLAQFCECFERILYQGLLPIKTVIAVIRSFDSWYWLEKLELEKPGIPFSYASCVEDVRTCARVHSNRGKVRLLIRYCLVKKCLHVPVEFIINEDRCCLLYSSDSVLGNSILSSMLASILHCLFSSVTFTLDLNNTMFLDLTWQLPSIANITFVPTKALGLSLIFIGGRAIVCKVLEDSVAAENDKILVGDILDSVNGVVINGKTQGSLSRLLKKSTNKPISVVIIKAVCGGQLYGPIIPLLRQAGLDPAVIQRRETLKEPAITDSSAIFFLGTVSTGSRGDVKQIQVAINSLQPQKTIPVIIECHHLGIRVVSNDTKEILKEHTYMEISSCGSSNNSSIIYFGYIAGDKNYAECKDFFCYIFSSKNRILVTP
ncbi:uncharacterized protein [Halyomorpha halys]|uniref:uncharacterized protein isoform X2 n=1 Tax=Halyomorpha halys TaxID=286706 RepID=UPI0006D4EF1F